MSKEIIIDSVPLYLETLRNAGISRIAFAVTNEKRSIQVEPNVLQVVQVSRVELLAYRDATIYKCVIPDAEIDKLHNQLISEGFEITRRNRNIT